VSTAGGSAQGGKGAGPKTTAEETRDAHQKLLKKGREYYQRKKNEKALLEFKVADNKSTTRKARTVT
jgi:hypothetical protein